MEHPGANMQDIKEIILMWIAYKLIPRRLAYWCYIRVHTHATVTKFKDKSPDQVTCFDAMKAWS